MLRVRAEIIGEIIEHARRQLPEEACGYLAAKDGVVCRCFELTNTDHSAEHFAMDPAEQFAALRECRSSGLTLKAVYHSHPETPARPSLEDIRLAHDPDLSYVIVSLLGIGSDVRSFVVKKGALEPEAIEIV